jgi:hypothetical protein
MLPATPELTSARIRELTGDNTIPDAQEVVLKAFRVVVGDRSFNAGFCIGDGVGYSAIGIAVIHRLAIETPSAVLHVAPITHADIAWDMVLGHLRTFNGQSLLFAFPDSDVYDAGTAEMFYSHAVEVFDWDGNRTERPSSAQRREIRRVKAEILNRPPPTFYASNVDQEDAPWIFRLATPAGKIVRTAVWNGRRNYAHEFPEDILRWVGGEKIAVVQVDSPVGVNRRSSLDLTHRFAKDFDGIIHWARDTETFESILKTFIRLDLESVSPPELPDGWDPQITIFAANGDGKSHP